MKRPLYVITACHDRRAVTLAFLETLLRQSYAPIRLILVDDGSSDGTADAVLSRMPDARILHGSGKLWWGGSLQKAYRYVRRELSGEKESAVMICNDDIHLPDGFCEAAEALLAAHPGTLVSGCGYDRDGVLRDGAYRRDFTWKGPEPDTYEPAWEGGDVCSSRCLLFTVGDMLRIGGFHPRLLPHYASDYAWTYKAYRKGFSIRMFPELGYTYDASATGDNFYGALTRAKLFSKRSAANPFYRISYILLATPPRYIPRELLRQIRRWFGKRDVLRAVLKRR